MRPPQPLLAVAGTAILILIVLLSLHWMRCQHNWVRLQSSERLFGGSLASLGLAIRQSVAKTMGSWIEVASQVGLRPIFTPSVGFELADVPDEALDAA